MEKWIEEQRKINTNTPIKYITQTALKTRLNNGIQGKLIDLSPHIKSANDVTLLNLYTKDWQHLQFVV